MTGRLKSSLFIAICAMLGFFAGTLAINRDHLFISETLIIGLFVSIIVGIVTYAFLLLKSWINQQLKHDTPRTSAIQENLRAYGLIGSTLLFPVIAFILGTFTKVSPASTLAYTMQSTLMGILATIPMIVILGALIFVPHSGLQRFIDEQITNFAKLGFRFTPLRILLISLGAGIGEELLFRGALQGWFAQYLPLAIAILIPSIIFGLLHSSSRYYMIIASIIGVYLGIIFAITGNILVPIIAHTLYDIVAFAYTEKLIIQKYGQERIVPQTEDT